MRLEGFVQRLGGAIGSLVSLGSETISLCLSSQENGKKLEQFHPDMKSTSIGLANWTITAICKQTNQRFYTC